MKGVVLMILAAFLYLAMVGAAPSTETKKPLPYPNIPRLGQEDFSKMLATEEVTFIILDVRPAIQWKFSDRKLPGAVHEDPERVDSWAQKYRKDATIVLY
jgi:hypothetical protein